MIRSNRLKLLLIFIAQVLNRRYYSVRIDPVVACNLRCLMCYFSKSRKSDSKKFSIDEIDIIANKLFTNALQVVVGCGAEPTMYRDYVYIVQRAKEQKVPYVSLVSNGQLITEENLKALFDAGLNELIISVHGMNSQTYERFMVGAQWNKLTSLLGAFKKIKDSNTNYSTSLRVNFTANAENYTELNSFFDVFGQYGVKTLQVRPLMNIGGEYFSEFSVKDIDDYVGVIRNLKSQCKVNGVTLLANIDDPSYSRFSKSKAIVEVTYKYISPNFVFDEGFDWKDESYRHFQRCTGWHKNILKSVFLPQHQVRSNDFAEKYSSKYDVF